MAAEDAGSIYSDVRIRLDKLEADITKAVGAINGLGDKIEKSSDQTSKKVTSNFDKIGAGAIVVGAAIAGAFRGMITTFASFEQSMANVQAVTGATSAELLVLKDAAAQAGATTRYSASQAANALFYLGSAGFTATEAVDALDGVLELAQATGSDLAETADTVAAAISQFNLKASESSRVANVFAAANAKSQASLAKLQSSMRQVGPVAGALDVSIEETTASLMALYNAGFQGEQAGTALRSILLELSSTSSVTSKKLKDLGVTVRDENGKFQGLTKSIEVLAESGINLGEVFGKETAAQILVLADASQKTEGNLRDLEASITGTEAAAEAAAIMTNTLAGSMDEFGSQAESAGNAAIESITPLLRGLLDFGSGVLSIFAKAPPLVQGFVVTLAALAGGFAIASGAASVFGVSLLTALAPIAPVLLGIGAAVAVVAGVAAAIDDGAKATDKLIAKNITLNKQLRDNQQAAAGMIGEINDGNKTNKLTEDQIKNLTELYPGLTKKINIHTATLEDAAKATRELAKEDASKALKETERALKDAEVQLKKYQVASTNPYQEKLLKDEQAKLEALKNTQAGTVKLLGAQVKLTEAQRQQAIAESEAKIAQYESNLQINKANLSQYAEEAKQAQNQVDTLRKQAKEQKEIASGIAFDRDDAASKASAAARRIASAQGMATAEIIKALEAERKAQLKGVEDKETIDRINEAFAEKAMALNMQLAGEQTTATAERIAKEEEATKKLIALKEEYATELEKINAKEVADLALAGKNEELRTKIKAKAEEDRKALSIKGIEEAKKAQDELAKYLERAGLSEIEVIKLNLRNERDERLAQAEKLIKDEKELADAKLKILADYQDKEEKAVKEADEKAKADREKELNEWVDTLKNQVDGVKKYADSVGGALSGLVSALASLASANTKNALELLDETTQAQLTALEEQTNAKLTADGLQADSEVESAQKALDAAIVADDAEAISEAKKELAKQKILADSANQKAKIEADYAKKKAQLEYEGAEQAWQASLASAIIGGALATINAVSTGLAFGAPAAIVMVPLLAGLAATAAGINIAAIAAQKPKPPKLATGGIVLPSQGGTTAVLAENGSPELALNAGASGAALLDMFAGRIVDAMNNRDGGGSPMLIVIEQDMMRTAEQVTEYQNGGQVRVKI